MVDNVTPVPHLDIIATDLFSLDLSTRGAMPNSSEVVGEGHLFFRSSLVVRLIEAPGTGPTKGHVSEQTT